MLCCALNTLGISEDVSIPGDATQTLTAGALCSYEE